MNSFSQSGKSYGLSIGDNVPDFPIESIVNYYKAQAKFSDFKGKYLILDFWATWCTPCIKLFPKLDTFQKKYADKLRILLVTRDEKQLVKSVLDNVREKTGSDLTVSVVNDMILSNFFKHVILPHYVWIDANGVVRAITGANEVSETNIEKFINNQDLKLEVKRDNYAQPDGDRPLFGHQVFNTDDEVQCQSIITKGLKQGLLSATSQRPNHIYATNVSIVRLYQLLYGRNRMEYLDFNRVALEGFDSYDSLAIGRITKRNNDTFNQLWSNFAYSYEMYAPDSIFPTEVKFKMMEQDLNRYFGNMLGITGSMEKREVKVLALVRTSGVDKIKSTGDRSLDNHSDFRIDIVRLPMHAFVAKLQGYIDHDADKPIIDETGYENLVDISLSGDLTSIENINRQLEKYDLKLVERIKTMDMIVLRKALKKL